MEVKRYCLALDLKKDQGLIEEYKKYHAPGNVWPEILQSIKSAGVMDLRIYQTGNRLFMIMEVDDTFSFEKKAKMDAINSKVQDWENLMWKYQQAMPWAAEGEKWVLMDQIFSLK